MEREGLAQGALAVAPRLLNLVLAHGSTAGRIVEVEAYRGADDAASHAFRGRTRRNGSMYSSPGSLYVYASHGMHACANVVCDQEGSAAAVLIRALEPLAGLEQMRRRRPSARSDDELCAGPGRLCAALGIGVALDGADLLAGEGVRLLDDGTRPPEVPLVGQRIGLGTRVGPAAQLPWRFGVPGSGSLSRPFGQRTVTRA